MVYIRKFVKEPKLWAQKQTIQRERKSEVRAPLLAIFKRNVLANTLNACWWMASGFIVAYSIGSLFPTHMQKDLGYSPAMVALPVMVQSFLFFAPVFCGAGSPINSAGVGTDLSGYRLPRRDAALSVHTGLRDDRRVLRLARHVWGRRHVCDSCPRDYPTEVRATAAGFCYHQGAIFGRLTAPIIAFFAVNWHLGFAIPMAIGTFGGTVSFIIAMSLGPETRGKHLTPELGVAVT